MSGHYNLSVNRAASMTWSTFFQKDRVDPRGVYEAPTAHNLTKNDIAIGRGDDRQLSFILHPNHSCPKWSPALSMVINRQCPHRKSGGAERILYGFCLVDGLTGSWPVR
jgi:hypothetical protein